MTKNRFHYAFKVKDIASTIDFYQGILGCSLGRQAEHWVDFEFYGHQLSAHVSENRPALDYCGKVDDVMVPIPHFGCILEDEQFETVRQSLESHSIDFIVPPQTRYKGEKGQQKTLFVLDYSQNALEFKCFENQDEVFTS